MKRLLIGLATLAGLFVIAAGPANALAGSTASNSNVSAYATSSCSNGQIWTTLHVTSKKNYQFVKISGAALYDGAYGSSYYVQRDNAAEFMPMYEGWLNAGQRMTYTWAESTPTSPDGDQVVFFVSAPNQPLLPVKVTCNT